MVSTAPGGGGGGAAPVIVTVTVAVLDVADVDLTLYVNVSVPLAPAFAAYVIAFVAALTSTVPEVGGVTMFTLLPDVAGTEITTEFPAETVASKFWATKTSLAPIAPANTLVVRRAKPSPL